MALIPISAVSASIFATAFIWLSFQVIKRRRQLQVAFGDGGHNQLNSAIRAHGNFSEYVPIFLCLTLCAEINHAHGAVLVPIIMVFCVGRAVHAYGFLFSKIHLKHRVLGMKLTFFSLVAAVVLNLTLVAFSLVAKQ